MSPREPSFNPIEAGRAASQERAGQAPPKRPGNPPTAEDAFLDLLVETLESLDRSVRAQFLQRFLRGVAQLELNEAQALECWAQILLRRNELSDSAGRPVALKTAMVDVLSTSNFLRVPILVEYDELKKLQINAATDALTGLYNRRLFEEYLEKELERAKRYSHHLALLMLDLHRFKHVNDTFGHMQGDLVLQAAASTLRKTMRTSDYAFRIGGDEFALLLPHTDPEQSHTLGRRLSANFDAAIEAMPVRLDVALDFGVAVFPEDGDEIATLIRTADERLYAQKHAARNGSTEFAAAKEAPAQPAPAARPAPQPAAEAPPRVHQPEAPRIIPMGTTLPREMPLPAPPAAIPAMPAAAAASPGAEKRRWERVSFAGTRAHAILESSGESAQVIDLSYGGVALHVAHPENLPKQFQAVLNVPILPSVRVNLRLTHVDRGENGSSLVGCAFMP